MSRATSAAMIERAVAWWKARRPEGWTEKEHLDSPTINCSTSFEASLARSAANVVRLRAKALPEHKKGCRYRRAKNLSVELACDHGLQACPKCDPCTCGSGALVKAVF